MRKTLFVILLNLFVISVVAQDEVSPLVEFGPSKTAGWEYNRDGFVYSKDNIINYKVILYKISSTKEYTLTSPLFDVDGLESLDISFDWKAINFDQPAYDKMKGSPTIYIIDEAGSVVNSQFFELPEKVLIQTLNVNVALNQLSRCRIRIAAPQADVNCTGAVKTVKVQACIRGSVDGIAQDKVMVKVDNGFLLISNCENSKVLIAEAATGRIVYNSTADCSLLRVVAINKGVHVIIVNNKAYKVVI